MPLSALLSSERRVSLVLDRPVFRVSEAARTSEKPFQVELPFAVDRGVIHEGEFHYRGRVRFRAGGVNAFFTWGKDDFRVQARCRETVVFLPGLEQPLTGTFQVSLEGGKGPVRVTRLVASGPSLYLKAAGDIQAASRTSLSFAGEFNPSCKAASPSASSSSRWASRS